MRELGAFISRLFGVANDVDDALAVLAILAGIGERFLSDAGDDPKQARRNIESNRRDVDIVAQQAAARIRERFPATDGGGD